MPSLIDKKVTCSYVDAVRVNDIMFINYVATFLNSFRREELVTSINNAYAINSIDMTLDQIQQLQSLGFESFWVDYFSMAMIYFYELISMVPPYNGQPGIIVHINTPAQLNMCVYDKGFSDGTYDYIDLMFVDQTKDITFDVDENIIDATTNINISKDDRQFLLSIIEA